MFTVYAKGESAETEDCTPTTTTTTTTTVTNAITKPNTNITTIRLGGLKPATCYWVWAEVATMLTSSPITTNKQLVCTHPARPPAIMAAMLSNGLFRC